MTPDVEIQVLSIDPLALERCFLVADVLADDFDEPAMEYGLLGVSTRERPFHVVATLLLTGQRVTAATVVQSGREVLRMRGEIDSLSRRLGRELLPILFVHRHLKSCDASETDRVFLGGVFVDQVSTLASFEETRSLDATDAPCGCAGVQAVRREAAGRPASLRSEWSDAFSLIVNRRRDHRLYAVRKRTCPFCRHSDVQPVPARLTADPWCLVSADECAPLRAELVGEVRRRVQIDRHLRIPVVHP